MVGLDKLPAELQPVMQSLIDGLQKWAAAETELTKAWVTQQMKASLDQMGQIVQSAEDRIDGAQLIAVVTVKLPQRGAKMAEPVLEEGKT